MTYDPYALAFPAPAFTVTSKDFTDGGALPDSAYQPRNESPELSWGPLPEGTRSLGSARPTCRSARSVD